MMVAHTYGIRRENGTYTRLIPADEIADPINHGVHATQGPEGMIVLPQLQLPPVEKRDNKWKDELVPNNVSFQERKCCVKFMSFPRSSTVCP